MILKEENKMNTEMNIRVIHSLPGRVRIRLSISPKSVQEMIGTVKNHPGIDEIKFNPHTKSVLLKYDPEPGVRSMYDVVAITSPDP